VANSEDQTTFKFDSFLDALGVAGYVEQLLSTEHQWIASRLSWLFISQSFCISAYIMLSTSNGIRDGAAQQIMILRLALPIIGIICSLTVGISVTAATAVARHLANERARLSQYINARTGTMIPLIGIDKKFRQDSLRWTKWGGGLPGWLPWILTALWLFLLVHI